MTVVEFPRRNAEPEVWVTVDSLCEEVGRILDGNVPTSRWVFKRIAEGMPSGKFLNRRMVPKERGLAWLREQGKLPA